MRVFIVLIKVDSREVDARHICESMEAIKLSIGGSVQAVGNDVRAKLMTDYSIPNEAIEVELLTDFMDRVNDQEFEVEKYFMSYVQA